MRSSRWLVLSLLIPVLCSPAARAHDEETLFNRIHLDAQAEREVTNDEIVIRFEARHQGKAPREIAGRVNADMEWALKEAKRFPAVIASTESYSTTPVYDKGVVQAWEARQELRLRAEDIAAATELAGVLQERLQLSGMQFQPTRTLRERTADELIEEALKAFHHRAGIVGKTMEGREYRIVDLHVSTQGGAGPMSYAERGMMMAKDAGAPAVEAGTSVIQVTVSGSVQFY